IFPLLYLFLQYLLYFIIHLNILIFSFLVEIYFIPFKKYFQEKMSVNQLIIIYKVIDIIVVFPYTYYKEVNMNEI
ncbi:hypothetical protein COF63_27775, partial [Bacillus pseudomycoides]